MTLVESIVNDLRKLPNAKLVEAARFVRELVPETSRRQREALAKLKGALGDEAGQAIEEALNEEDACAMPLGNDPPLGWERAFAGSDG